MRWLLFSFGGTDGLCGVAVLATPSFCLPIVQFECTALWFFWIGPRFCCFSTLGCCWCSLLVWPPSPPTVGERDMLCGGLSPSSFHQAGGWVRARFGADLLRRCAFMDACGALEGFECICGQLSTAGLSRDGTEGVLSGILYLYAPLSPNSLFLR